MKYSIIISYRNREHHLTTLLPKLTEMFQEKDFEIIIAEQDDDKKFMKTCLYNTAVKYATGDVFIFHDVDYYPTDDVSYEFDEDVVIYPVRKVMFVDENMNELSNDKVPSGYRNFKYDVGEHSGGVVIVSREHFFKMNGYNPAYVGWGKEDDEFMQRILFYGLAKRRNEHGTYLGLPHADNAPPHTDPDFQKNVMLQSRMVETCWMGIKQTKAVATEFEFEVGGGVGRWLKITDCGVDAKLVSVLIPTRRRTTALKQSIENMINNAEDPSQIEFVLKIDSDDTETIEFVKNTNFDATVVPVIKERHQHGYAGIPTYLEQMIEHSSGHILLFFADDCYTETPKWDTLVKPFVDDTCIINPINTDNVPFNVFVLMTRSMRNVIGSFGSHPYLDRWFHELCIKFPQIKKDVPIRFIHNREYPNLSLVEGAPVLQPKRNVNQQKEWSVIEGRVKSYLTLYGKL